MQFRPRRGRGLEAACEHELGLEGRDGEEEREAVDVDGDPEGGERFHGGGAEEQVDDFEKLAERYVDQGDSGEDEYVNETRVSDGAKSGCDRHCGRSLSVAGVVDVMGEVGKRGRCWWCELLRLRLNRRRCGSDGG